MTNRIKIVEYVAPAKAEAPNPFVADLDGIQVGQAFAIDTTVKAYKSEKLLIQRAANILGFSAREVQKPDTDGLTDDDKVTMTFLARPARKTSDSETDSE